MHPIFKNSSKTFLISQNKCPLCNKLLKTNKYIIFCNSKTCSLNNNSFAVGFKVDSKELYYIGFKIKKDYCTIQNDNVIFNNMIFNIYDIGITLPLNIEKIIDKINTIKIFS